MAEASTPVMSQYQSIKALHPDAVLFFRLGDFYEMFDGDAKEVSRLLNLTLTQRSGHPMCGIPFHAAKVYTARLLRLGKKIAVCEQVGDSKAKGLTERKVVEIITPGTATEEEYLEKNTNNYLAAVCVQKNKTGFAYIDITTAAFYATSWDTSRMAESFARCLGIASPRELLVPESLYAHAAAAKTLASFSGIFVSRYPDWHFAQEAAYKRLCAALGVISLKSFGLLPESPEVPAAGFLLGYLEKNSALPVSHVTGLHVFSENDFVVIDDSTRRNLEIAANLQDGTMAFTLFDAVNYTKTAMGTRLLAEWLFFPLKNPRVIRERQEQVSRFVSNRSRLEKVRAILGAILDMERLSSRIAMEKAHAKDLQALRGSLEAWLELRAITDDGDFSGIDTADAREAVKVIDSAILREPSALLTEGGIIKDGWSSELDHLRKIQNNFNDILNEYAESERAATGISNLKIRYNRLSGYYIEISKGKLPSVPAHFILRRTLVNGDRYTTEKLSELEDDLLSAGQKIIDMEKQLFIAVRNDLKKYTRFFQSAAKECAYIDVTACYAHAAVMHKWQMPLIDESGAFTIAGGRHPVVEKNLPSGEFVPNDTALEDGKTFALVTGPNMAGKSTYLRQNALIALLAQTGSFVPASKAHVGVVDRIFCRVGASDNLARGESTFLVEMTETAHILRNATEHSLVIMDEVGRGTSTEDGLSIAWAVSEYLLETVRCKTFFATHYHELTRLSHRRLLLLCMDVRENGGQIVFLKKIKQGSAESSYGIHVARLAGVPAPVLERAEAILNALRRQAGETTAAEKALDAIPQPEQPRLPAPREPSLFSDEELILDEILSCSPDTMTPIEALTLLSRWKKSLAGR